MFHVHFSCSSPLAHLRLIYGNVYSTFGTCTVFLLFYFHCYLVHLHYLRHGLFPSSLLTDICHDLLNLYNDQDQEGMPKEEPSKQATASLPPPPAEAVSSTLAGQASLSAVTPTAQTSDQQQPNPPPLPPPQGTALAE